MTSPSHPEPHGAGSHSSGDDAETTRLPTASGTDIAGAAQPDEHRAAAAAVLDQPLDEGDLASRVHRPGMARSTRILLALLLAVLLVALGTWIGRATARRTGPGSMPDVIGTVESVGGPGNGQITVRGADGTATVFTTTAGTKVAVPATGGLGGVRVGQRVTVSSERNRLGGSDASIVEVPAG